MLGPRTGSDKATIDLPANSFHHALTGQLTIQDPYGEPVITQSKYDEIGLVSSLLKYSAANINQLVCIAGIIALLLVFSLSVFALQHMGVWVVRLVTGKHQPISPSYSDRDGVAAPKTSRNAVGWSFRVAMLAAVAIGTVASSLQTALLAQHSVILARYWCWTRVGIWVWASWR